MDVVSWGRRSKIRCDACLKIAVSQKIRPGLSDTSEPSSSNGWAALNESIEGDIVAVVYVACREQCWIGMIVADFCRFGGIYLGV